MRHKPKITIIIPVYNSQEYLKKAIDSAVKQSLKEIEIICINDCSSDNSQKLLKKYSKEHKKLKVITNKKNVGPGKSRNRGIIQANGEFLMFLDSDDSLEINACKELYDFAKKNDSDMVIINPTFNEDTKISKYSKKFENKEEFLKETLKEKTFWAPWAKMLRTDTIKKNNCYFPEIYISEDTIFSIKSIFFSKRITYFKKKVYNYFIREDSIMSSKNDSKKIDDYQKAVNLLYEFAKKNPKMKKYQKEIIYFKMNLYLKIYILSKKNKNIEEKAKILQKIKKDPELRLQSILRLKIYDKRVIAFIFLKIRILGILLDIFKR